MSFFTGYRRLFSYCTAQSGKGMFNNGSFHLVSRTCHTAFSIKGFRLCATPARHGTSRTVNAARAVFCNSLCIKIQVWRPKTRRQTCLILQRTLRKRPPYCAHCANSTTSAASLKYLAHRACLPRLASGLAGVILNNTHDFYIRRDFVSQRLARHCYLEIFLVNLQIRWRDNVCSLRDTGNGR